MIYKTSRVCVLTLGLLFLSGVNAAGSARGHVFTQEEKDAMDQKMRLLRAKHVASTKLKSIPKVPMACEWFIRNRPLIKVWGNKPNKDSLEGFFTQRRYSKNFSNEEWKEVVNFFEDKTDVPANIGELYGKGAQLENENLTLTKNMSRPKRDQVLANRDALAFHNCVDKLYSHCKNLHRQFIGDSRTHRREREPKGVLKSEPGIVTLSATDLVLPKDTLEELWLQAKSSSTKPMTRYARQAVLLWQKYYVP